MSYWHSHYMGQNELLTLTTYIGQNELLTLTTLHRSEWAIDTHNVKWVKMRYWHILENQFSSSWHPLTSWWLCLILWSQTASTSVSKQTAVSWTSRVSSHARKPFRNLSLSCCFLTTAPFSPTRRKPYSTSLTASLMQPRPGQRHLQWCHSQQGSWEPLVRSQQFL